MKNSVVVPDRRNELIETQQITVDEPKAPMTFAFAE